MFPRGIPLGSITRRSHKYPPDMQLPRQPQIRLAVTRILRPPHPARPAGRRNPPPRFRSASPPPGSPPTANHEDAPRPGLRHHVRSSHHASGPQDSRRDALGIALRVRLLVSSTSEARAATSGRYGVKCCPRHSRRFRVRASLVQLGHSCGIT